MGNLGINREVGQVKQGWDESIRVRSREGTFPTQAEAEAHAETVAASETQDAVVRREGDQFSVYGTDEIGTLDAGDNDVGRYEIHDLDPNVVSFSATPRNQEGEALGREPVTAPVNNGEAVVEFGASRVEDGVVHLDENTVDFREHIAGLESGGDSIRVFADAEAGLRFGFGGVEVEGNLDLTVSKDDDGLYTVSYGGRIGGFGTANVGDPRAAHLQGEAGAAYQHYNAFRSSDPEEINNFLLHTVNSLPGASTYFGSLAQGPDMSNAGVHTTNIGELQAEVHGKAKIGNIEVEGQIEGTLQGRWTTYADGREGDDWARTIAANVSLGDGSGIGVALSGQHTTYTVNNNPVPENNGRYQRFDGSLQLTFDAAQAASFTGGDTARVSAALLGAGAAMGLQGELLDRFVEDGQGQVSQALARQLATAGAVTAGDIRVGIATEMQWEMQTENGQPSGEPIDDSGRLQYLRMGATATVGYGANFDAVAAYGRLDVGITRTDMADAIVGTSDITYIQGVFFGDRELYARLKDTLGGDQTVVQGRTLAQWEQDWASTRYNRTTETLGTRQ